MAKKDQVNIVLTEQNAKIFSEVLKVSLVRLISTKVLPADAIEVIKQIDVCQSVRNQIDNQIKE